MLVSELIEHLQKYPKGTMVGVVFRQFSDLVVLNREDIQFIGKADLDANPEALSMEAGYRSTQLRYVYRNGQLMEYNPQTWDPKEVPNFVPVIIFPGN